MPDYRATFTYLDSQNGETTRSFTGTFLDAGAAVTALSNLLVDLNNATKAAIVRTQLTEVTDIAASPAANTTIFENVSATVNLSGGNKGNLALPAPVDAMMSGNALNPAATQWTDVLANFSGSAWQISDGEDIVDTVSGKRVYLNSGKTNLPR